MAARFRSGGKRRVLNLKDKVAIVTGCGSSGPGWGNGKATAVLFARQGARIAGFAVGGGARAAPGGGKGRPPACLSPRQGARIAGFDVDDAAAAETRRLIEAEGGA